MPTTNIKIKITIFLLVYGRIRIQIVKDPYPGGPKTFGSGTLPETEHFTHVYRSEKKS
jgi:hypothetical protein